MSEPDGPTLRVYIDDEIGGTLAPATARTNPWSASPPPAQVDEPADDGRRAFPIAAPDLPRLV